MYKYFLILFVLAACTNVNKLTVYNSEVIPTDGINGFTSTDVFSTGGTDEVWGNKDSQECNPFSYSSLDASVDYSANSKVNNPLEMDSIYMKLTIPNVNVKGKREVELNSLHIKTDYSPSCKWIGMGIGWDAWQGKDLSGIVDKAALEFMARVDGAPTANIPIVFILEDYSANQCYATVASLGIDGGQVSEKWTKVRIPLSTFSYSVNNIDLTNVKQLLLQCYNKVDIYIDDIKIVPHKHNFKREKANLHVTDTIFPVEIFTEDLHSAWGVNQSFCSNFSLLSSNDRLGKYIDVNIDFAQNNCDWKEFGISWNNWLYTDISNSIHGVFLQFDIQIDKCKEAKISIEDYGGKKMWVDAINYVKSPSKHEWTQVRIPLRKFPIRDSSIDLKRVKSIVFSFKDKTKLKLDNIKLTN